MNVREMPIASDLTLAAVMEAHRMLNELEAGSHAKAVSFVELRFAPDLQQMTVAEYLGAKLLKLGIGVKISVEWAFSGTRRWALQTELTRVVNRGP